MNISTKYANGVVTTFTRKVYIMQIIGTKYYAYIYCQLGIFIPADIILRIRCNPSAAIIYRCCYRYNKKGYATTQRQKEFFFFKGVGQKRKKVLFYLTPSHQIF